MARASGSGPKAAGTARRRQAADLLLRLPRSTKAELDALSGLTGLSISALVADAVASYVGALPAADRRLLRGVKARRSRQSR
jgi:hypothetical protein